MDISGLLNGYKWNRSGEAYRYLGYLESKKQMNKSSTHKDAENRLMVATGGVGK